MNIAPEKVMDALEHVHKHHPEVTQVFYGRDQRWLYCGEAFDAPAFGPEIDVGLLEDAADCVPFFPVAYALCVEEE